MLSTYYKVFIFSLLSICCVSSYAQNEVDFILERLSINKALYPPEDILSTKSVVLFSVPEEDLDSEWRERIDELQQFFADEGIDAISYIKQSDLFPLPNQVLDIPDYMKQREIKNVILFLMRGNEDPMFLAIGPYNQKANWWDAGANFWVRSPTEWQPMFDELDTYLKTGVLKLDNLLVNDQPEFLRFEIPNNYVFSASVPRTTNNEVQIGSKGIDVGFYDGEGPQIFSQEGLFNNQNRLLEMQKRKDALEAFASDSTNIVELVEPTSTSRQMSRVGIDYELKWITGNAELINGFFKSSKERESFEGVRTVFYLQDVRRNQIYYGKEWSPKLDWMEALEDFKTSFAELLTNQGS